MTATIEERIAAGAAWLDANRPGWVDRIDLDTLRLDNPCRCILGQEYGDFYTAPYEIRGVLGEMATQLGFDAKLTDDGADYAELTEAWQRLILARRAGARCEDLDHEGAGR